MVAAMDLMDSEGGDEVPEYLDKRSNGCIERSIMVIPRSNIAGSQGSIVAQEQ